MRAEKSESKAAIPHPVVRSLKIQPKIRNNRWSDSITPEIKLCGNWLANLGFHHGKRVEITCVEGILTIRLQTE